MAHYGKVFTRVWRDEKFRELTDDGRTLFLYLLTSPHLNMIGFYYLPPAYAADDLRWASSKVLTQVGVLVDAGLVRFDAQRSVILIPKYLKWNPFDNINQAKGGASNLRDLPSTSLVLEFRDCIKQYAKEFEPAFFEMWDAHTNPSETPSEPLPMAFETHPNSVTVSVAVTEAVTVNKDPSTDGMSADADGAVSGEAGKQELTPQQFCEEVVDFYNQTFQGLWKRPLLLTDDRKGKILARRKRFPLDDLKQAIVSIRASPFHCGENDKNLVYATPEFIFRNDGMVDKWLNMEVSQNGRADKPQDGPGKPGKYDDLVLK